MKWKPSSDSHLTFHEQIVNWIKSRIESGDWSVGTKLPTQRQLATQLNVNRSTIQLALEELKADGILQSKVGSGVFVANHSWNVLLKMQPNWKKHIESSIHRPNYHTIQLINEYEQYNHIIRLGTGELSPELLPTKQIEQSLKEIFLDAKSIGYSSPQGNEKLRIILCDYLKRLEIYAKPENILIVSGALQALQLIAIGLLEEGSVIFHEQPSYLSSIHPFQSAGMRMYSVKRDDGKLTDQLKAFKRRRQSIFYCVPTLNNPTGVNWSIEEKQNLYKACNELQIPIIEDDVYHELLFDISSPTIKSLDESGQVLYIGSVSKTLSPGLRIGWIVGPSPVIERLADIKMQTDYGSSAFSQEIVAHWISTGLYEKHLINLRQQLKSRAQFTEKILETQFKEIATWNKPQGGFYIWLRFNKPIVNKALFLNLLNKNILINPGYIYDSSDSHHIRLSYAYGSLEEIREGLTTLRMLTEKG